MEITEINHAQRTQSQAPAASRLCAVLPKAGMVFEFPNGNVLKRGRRDTAVIRALRAVYPPNVEAGGTNFMPTRQFVDQTFAKVFEVATRLKQEDSRNMTLKLKEPLEFLVAVRADSELLPFSSRITMNQFIHLFLTIRAARLNWYDEPTYPYNTDQHALVAKQIDEFKQVDNTDWGDVEMIKWTVNSYAGIAAANEIVEINHNDDEQPDFTNAPSASESLTVDTNTVTADVTLQLVPRQGLTVANVMVALWSWKIRVEQAMIEVVFARMGLGNNGEDDMDVAMDE